MPLASGISTQGLDKAQVRSMGWEEALGSGTQLTGDIITIFTAIKIMTCGELVGCVESHGGAGCLPRVNSNAHGEQCTQHILADQVRFNKIFQHI